MTSHHAGHTPRNRQASPADPLLDQLAAHIAAARATGNPAIASLAPAEATFTAGLLSRLEGLDAPAIGAVLLAAGYYAGEFLKTLRAEDTASAPAAVVNLVQLAGQQLYVARVASKGVCGLPWPNGKPCTQVFEAADDETLAAKMRGHAALNHPGQEWSAHAGDAPEPRTREFKGLLASLTGDYAPEPRAMEPSEPGEYDLTVDEAVEAMRTGLVPVGSRSQPEPDGDGDDLCACGEPAEVVVGSLPAKGRGTVISQCLDCARTAGNTRLGGTPRPKHAPHELCDCQPGETYHCAAAANGEAQS